MPDRGSAPSPRPLDKFRYWFDNVMAKGTVALMGLLALASVAFIALVAAVVVIFGMFPKGVDDLDFWDVLWGNLMRTLDSGTMGGDEGWGFRWAMLVVTVGGVVIVASLIGIISGAFDSKVEELRKGRSRVLESDHTLILGWNTKVFSIVSEICVANESRRRAAIVIVADRDKVEMEDELRAKIAHPGRTRLIVRSGDPMDLTDLELGSPHAARSIIVLAPEGSDDPDSVVIKTTLAVTNNPRRGSEPFHIVGEIQDAQNMEAARLVGRGEADWVLARDFISRITVQACRQSGLSGVYTELLDFDGDEIYFTEQPSLVGTTYFDAQLSFLNSGVMGLVKNDVVHINPDAATIIETGDKLIVIAEDDSVIRLGTPGIPATGSLAVSSTPEEKPERTLVLGYNSDVRIVLDELKDYVARGSSVTVAADVPPPDLPTYDTMLVEFLQVDTTSRAALEALDVARFDHIIVLAYKEMLDHQRADAKTLITLLHLREIGERAGIEMNIVSEMLDDRNREIAEVTKADDFIVSDKLISLTLSQISENRQLIDVFDTLFSSEGSEIYLRSASDYIVAGASVDFYSVLEAARRRGETAIGYRLADNARSSQHRYGVKLNPRKDETVTFGPEDKIIVLAEN